MLLFYLISLQQPQQLVKSHQPNYETPIHSIRSIENESLDLNGAGSGGGGCEFSQSLPGPTGGSHMLRNKGNNKTASTTSSSHHGSGSTTPATAGLKYKPILKHTSGLNRAGTVSGGSSANHQRGGTTAANTADCASISMASNTGLDSASLLAGRTSTPLIVGYSPSGSNIPGARNAAVAATGDTASSTNLSIMNESDSVSAIMRMRQEGKDSRPYSLARYDQMIDAADFFYSSSSNSNLSSCPTVLLNNAAPVHTAANQPMPNSSSSGDSTTGQQQQQASGNKQHFSPRSSMKIKVIDETETDN